MTSSTSFDLGFYVGREEHFWGTILTLCFFVLNAFQGGIKFSEWLALQLTYPPPESAADPPGCLPLVLRGVRPSMMPSLPSFHNSLSSYLSSMMPSLPSFQRRRGRRRRQGQRVPPRGTPIPTTTPIPTRLQRQSDYNADDSKPTAEAGSQERCTTCRKKDETPQNKEGPCSPSSGQQLWF
jgi:hypothetical protein